ncbi:MAG: ABC transporter ATP-binding protein, partial [Victivallaceae bacterium]|nr:ABC transporter ATP-binding protein [Victivallaceae bacterium]
SGSVPVFLLTREDAMAKLEIRKLVKSFGDRRVIDDLDLTVDDGEIFFLLGSSGCGKSTLLRMVAGLLEPDSGGILFDGVSADGMPAEERSAAMVFQDYALWPHMTVFENVAFGLECRHCPRRQIRERVEEVLDLVRLDGLADRKVPLLSGGQQQRVALARALAVRPRLLLLDEPLSNLDARLRETMRTEIRRICRKERLTALYVTHDRQEAFSIGDRLALLDGGRIRQQGTPRELYTRPVDRFAAEFFGDANFISGEATGGRLKTAFGTFGFAGSGDGKVTAMIRRENIRFARGGFGAVVTDVCFLGECSRLTCATADGTTLTVCGNIPAERSPGDAVELGFDDGALVEIHE